MLFIVLSQTQWWHNMMKKVLVGVSVNRWHILQWLPKLAKMKMTLRVNCQ